MTTGAPERTLQEKISKAEERLLTVMRRQYLLSAFVDELERVSKKKEFRTWNDLAWLLLLDTRDAHVIHLASWAKSIFDRNGLLMDLQANNRSEFSSEPRLSDRSKNDPCLKKLRERTHREAYQRLFPDSTGTTPSRAEFNALRERFKGDMEGLVDDRNVNRAHPFDPNRKGSARMLDIAELHAAIECAQRTMNDLRLVCMASTYGYHDVSIADASEAAKELVDAVLIGTSTRRNLVMAGRDREVYYQDLHDCHDANPDERFFNVGEVE